VTSPSAATLRHGFHRLAVERVVDETADARSFVLAIPPELEAAFSYRPGQFCTVRVRIDGDEHLRSYSMSSAPVCGDPFTLTVKRVPGGLVSNWLLDHVAAGDTLELTRPAGVFCAGDVDAPVVGLCGGSGVTPVIAIAKHVLASTARPVRMLYANRDRGAVIFDEALADLATRHPGRFDLRHHLDEDGYLDADRVRDFVADVVGDRGDAEFFVCGPAPFMALVESVLLDAGVPPKRIAIERFTNAHEVEPEPAAHAETGTDGRGAGTADAEAPVNDIAPTTVTVILKGKRHDIEYRPGDTLLGTARRGGLAPPFSCEAGNCATCMALLREGAVTMRTNNALDDDEVAEGWVLTCQSIPQGTDPVVVEYESF
jgi:ferredoxin-NADP reductase